ncbi:MAG: hypothetical protein V1820_05125 [archaeon]
MAVGTGLWVPLCASGYDTTYSHRGKASPYGWKGKEELAKELLEARHTAARELHSRNYPLEQRYAFALRALTSAKETLLNRLPTGIGEGEEGPRQYAERRFAEELGRIETEYARLLRGPETGVAVKS